MLLPSDIARLVLGYLQQEGLRGTTKAFILESPSLKEYAEHSTDDGAIPACVFSLFGKNLTTILNEYVAVKAKESCAETQVPAMMTSLWKKLDFTLNQIKCMQNSPTVYQNQRFRTRNGIMNMRGQRSLPSCPRSPSTALLSVPAPVPVPTPVHHDSSPLASPQGTLGHSTPVCYSSLQTRPSPLSVSQSQVPDVGRLVISMSRESPLHIMVPDRRINSGPLSPGRRKCDSPRRRGGGLCGPTSGTGRAAAAPTGGQVPDQQNDALQEGVAENFPQMVIENARDKILNDKSLQEKLAENINKILGSDSNPQSSKLVACSTVVPDQSIDEILGLQGEIHMSNDAIQDILEQTESDPAFQALFDLFDYGKNKDSEGESPLDTSLSNTTQESDEAVSSPQIGDPGTSQEEPTSGPQSSSETPRTRSTQDLKSKKCRKTVRAVSTRAKSSPALSKRACSLRKTGATPTGGRKSRAARPKAQSGPAKAPPNSALPEEEEQEAAETALPSAGPVHAGQQSPEISMETGGENDGLSLSGVEPGPLSTAVSAQKQPGDDRSERSGEGQATDAERPECQPPHGPSQPVPQPRTPPLNTTGPSTSPARPDGQKTDSFPSAQAHSASPTLGREPDPSKIVSLKIIVSDEADDQSADSALSQAVSSITGERLPTIILSSPAKTPAKAAPATASSSSPSVTQEETAQAVCGLQGAELGPGLAVEESVRLSVSGGGDSSQEAGFVQLVPGPAPYGNAGGYIIVADPADVTQQAKLVVLPTCPALGQASPASHLLTTPPRTGISVAQDVTQAYSPGSTLFISSPSQPLLQSMMVPLSVVGQSGVGNFAVVQNQLLQVTAPGVKTPAKVKAKPKLAPKNQAASGKARTTDQATKSLEPNSQCLLTALKPQSERTADSSQSSETDIAGPAPGQQQAVQDDATGHAPGPGSSSNPHRRVLRFDAAAETPDPAPKPAQAEQALPAPKGPTSRPTALVSAPCGQQTQKEAPSGQSPGSCKLRTVQPAILRGGRTVEGRPRPEAAKGAERKGPSEKTPRECERGAPDSLQSPSRSSSQQEAKATPPEPAKRQSECRRKSHQTEKKDDEGSSSAHGVKSAGPGHRTASKRADSKKIRAEKSESVQKSKEAWTEKRGSSQPALHITANKENEVEQSRSEQLPACTAPQEDSAPASAGSVAAPAGRAPSMTSPLTKQAAEMLQGIHGHNPAATPAKRALPLPRTPGSGSYPEDPADALRTPVRQRAGRDGDGTPRHHLPPPATPDLPTCSPASEAGSESSINMAAHTLMILSRAAIARTGTPLKDSARQQGANPKSKKRKLAESLEPQHTGSAASKKAKKQKKMLDSFPDDLDVDKFLSSLHYDE